MFEQKLALPTAQNYAELITQKIQAANDSKELPTDKASLDAFAQTKAPTFNKYLKINLTKKKQDTLRDMTSDLFLGTTNGYQELKARWKNCNNEVIKALNNAKDSFQRIYIAIDSDQSMSYLINESNELSTNPNEWLSESVDLTDEEQWQPVDQEQDTLLCNAYMCSEIIFEKQSNMTGFNHEDIEYLKDNFGIKFIGDKTQNYHPDRESDGDKIVLMMTRPSNQEIDAIIKSLSTKQDKSNSPTRLCQQKS